MRHGHSALIGTSFHGYPHGIHPTWSILSPDFCGKNVNGQVIRMEGDGNGQEGDDTSGQMTALALPPCMVFSPA